MSEPRRESRPGAGMGGPRGPGGMMGGQGPAEKPKDMKKTLRRFFSYFGARKIQFAIVMALAVLQHGVQHRRPEAAGKGDHQAF